MDPAPAIEFFYEGHRRLDWGLGNPNKTAVLIACLMVMATALTGYLGNSRGRMRYVAFLAVFAWLGVSLVETYSRGGIVSLVAGMIVLSLVEGKRLLSGMRHSPEIRWRAVAFLSVLLGLTAYAGSGRVEALDRFLQDADEDRSIGNRLVLWKSAPRMMWDAPGGWGRGKSGEAWMQWYQPLNTKYRYRTMVNSHLTRLVESGWSGRFAWILGWLLVLAVCLPGKGAGEGKPGEKKAPRFSDRGIALGVVLALGTGAVFSSVLESRWVWVPALVAVGCLVVDRSLSGGGWRVWWGRWRVLVMGTPVVATLAVGCLLVVGALSGGDEAEALSIWHQDGVTEVRAVDRQKEIDIGQVGEYAAPLLLLIEPDPAVLGTHYGHEVRKRVVAHPVETWRVADKGVAFSSGWQAGASVVILSGQGAKIKKGSDLKNASIYWLNPLEREGGKEPDVKGLIVWLGNSRRDSLANRMRKKVNCELVEVAGSLHYMPNWANRIPVLP